MPCTGPKTSAWSTKLGWLLLSGEVERMLKDDGLAETQKDDGMSWGEDVRATENCGVWCRHKGYSGMQPMREGHLGG